MGRNEEIYETAKFYKDKKQSIHLKLNSRVWLNGIISFIEGDRLILDEERFGEMIILFSRIMDDGIEPREARKNG